MFSARRLLAVVLSAAVLGLGVPALTGMAAAGTGDTGPMMPEVQTTRVLDVTSVPVTLGAPWAYRSAAHLTIPGLLPGDVVTLTGEVQLTTNYKYNVMVCRGVTVTPTPSAELPAGTKFLARPMGENFDLNVHHHTTAVSTAYVVPATATGEPLSFNLLVYAASTAAKPGHKLKVDWVEWTAVIFRQR
jgi:hypothetical protein